MDLTIVQKIAIWALPVLFAITLHEAAHALVANRLGDSTAKMLGRLSLNPLRHIDPFGTILVPLLIGALTQFQFVFGWAKPVPINYNQLRNPRVDMALVAAAGPVSNLIMALLWAACLKLGVALHPQSSMLALFLVLTGQAGILINLLLCILNLIPLPPLDGSRVVASLLPPRQAYQFMKLEPYGFMILLALLLTGVLNSILSPVLSWSFYTIKVLFQL